MHLSHDLLVSALLGIRRGNTIMGAELQAAAASHHYYTLHKTWQCLKLSSSCYQVMGQSVWIGVASVIGNGQNSEAADSCSSEHHCMQACSHGGATLHIPWQALSTRNACGLSQAGA